MTAGRRQGTHCTNLTLLYKPVEKLCATMAVVIAALDGINKLLIFVDEFTEVESSDDQALHKEAHGGADEGGDGSAGNESTVILFHKTAKSHLDDILKLLKGDAKQSAFIVAALHYLMMIPIEKEEDMNSRFVEGLKNAQRVLEEAVVNTPTVFPSSSENTEFNWDDIVTDHWAEMFTEHFDWLNGIVFDLDIAILKSQKVVFNFLRNQLACHLHGTKFLASKLEVYVLDIARSIILHTTVIPSTNAEFIKNIKRFLCDVPSLQLQ